MCGEKISLINVMVALPRPTAIPQEAREGTLQMWESHRKPGKRQKVISVQGGGGGGSDVVWGKKRRATSFELILWVGFED